MPRPALTEEGFWSKVRKTRTCWIWTGGRHQRQGYGTVSWKGKQTYAHRVAYALSVAPIPEGLHVLHHCDNPACVRPDHLFVGTHADNMRDRWNKGRYSSNRRGEAINTAKLTADQVIELRRRYNAGETQTQLAGAYGIGQSCVWSIIHRKSWKHV